MKNESVSVLTTKVNPDNILQILEENNVNLEEEEVIVGIAPAVGFWTRKLFGERIATIMAQADSMKKGESTKFWQNFIKASRAQERSRGAQYQRK